MTEVIDMNDISTRIYERRKALGLTLEQVGDAVGVGKSTVRKWETGAIENMRRDKIQKLAAVLQMTPGQLLGWEKQKAPAVREKVDLSDDETALVEMFRRVPKNQRKLVLQLIRAALEK